MLARDTIIVNSTNRIEGVDLRLVIPAIQNYESELLLYVL